MSEEYKIGEINHGGAICPNCDHLVNLDGIKIPSEVDCPNCGTAMKARPEKTVETANKLINEEEDTTPMNTLAEEAPESTKSELKVEVAKLNAAIAYTTADLTEATTELREVRRDRMNEANEFRKEIQDLTTKLSSKTREVATLEFLKNRISEMTELEAKNENEIDDLQNKVSEFEKIVASKEARLEGMGKELSSLKDDYEKLRVQNEDVRNNRNELSVLARASEEKALNETRERSRIELDNADLLDKQRQLTAEISKLTERISLSATQKLEQEKALAALLTENLKLKKTHEGKLAEAVETIEKAKKFHTWAWQQLKEAGVAVLQKEE